ncbi:MAG TPA: hypothetical protein VJP85_13730 [Candidatus Baltobacteraceae bacterium]|nr:hypothetical protein [Candidatus Baltobacteraceae bacterium]
MQPKPGIGATLLRAWGLLCANPLIIVPSILLGIASAAIATVLSQRGVLSWAFFSDMDVQGPGAFWYFFGTIVAMALRIVAAVAAIAFTAGMAAAAWRSGTAQFADGAEAFRRNGVQAALALVLLTLVGLVAAALVVPTFGLSVLLYMIFLLYAMPAVLVGNRGAYDAIVESVSIAWRSFGVTFVVVLLVIALAVAGGKLGDLAAGLPFVGQLLGWVVMEAVVAYATLVVVGEYLQLGSPADQAP